MSIVTEYNRKIVTKKKHRKTSRQKKRDKWAAFDIEIKKKNKKLECLYSKANVGDITECDFCGTILRFTSYKFLSCPNKKCGIIYKNILDQTAEWRYYGAKGSKSVNPTRCGMPINPLLKESSYGCAVVCNGRSSWEMRKIRRYTEWQSMPYIEKSQYDDFQHIKVMAEVAGIPQLIIDDALKYHKKISVERTFRGLNRDGIIAASIYISCRIHGWPRTAKEIGTIFNLDNASATKGCKNAISILNNIEKKMGNEEKTRFYKTQSSNFIERFCSRLNLNKELTKLSIFICLRIEQNNFMCGNTPHSVAGGVLYLISNICKLNISKKDISAVSEISEVTINKCYKKLLNYKSHLFPSFILKKYINL